MLPLAVFTVFPLDHVFKVSTFVVDHLDHLFTYINILRAWCFYIGFISNGKAFATPDDGIIINNNLPIYIEYIEYF